MTEDLYPLIPKGWCHFEARISAEDGTRAALYVDTGKGFDPVPAAEVDNDPLDGAQLLVRIPAATCALRFDPVAAPTQFRLGSVTVTQASLAVQLGRAARLRPCERRRRLALRDPRHS